MHNSCWHDIRNYSFFSYEAREALHLSEEERHTVIDCLHKIDTELKRPADKHSRRLITANIGLLLDYCMRFYERQFTTREASNKDIIVRFEQLLDEYFDGQTPQEEGLPTVKYFAERVFLSPNYFGDLVKRETGPTAQEHIQLKLLEVAKERVLYVGDSGVDMQTAAAAGVRSVGVTWGFRERTELEEAGARHIVDNPAKILELL